MTHHDGITRRSAFRHVAAGATTLAAASIGLDTVTEAKAQAERAVDPQVKAFEEKMLQARPLDMKSVRLTGGPLKQAQDVTVRYLLSLEPDRMLAFFRVRAGLQQKGEPYGGWDAGGRQLTGHIAGHYLSAVSYMYAATGDARFKERADYIVKEFKEVQDKNGDGYLCALENGRRCFEALAKGDIRSGGFDLNGEWSPWYTLHKAYAGLRDAYRYTGNRTALEVEINFSKWAEGILSKLNDAQIQRMLNTEFGGMNEVLADLYADTGDKRWLELSYKFEHRSFVEPLKNHEDNLANRHGNLSIPQAMGAADRFAYTGKPGDIMFASFFFDRVAHHHSYATGGHGLAEYFGEPDKLADRVDGRVAESCNIYNMLKLSRRLFALRPDVDYVDFHERALFNHVLASIDPEDGRTCYMVPVGRGVTHEYQNMQRSFTCCVGSGMESHALHADGIYYESGDKLWVNLYAPSTADWAAAGVNLKVETGFPEGESATVKLALKSPKEFTLMLRRPYWALDGFAVKVNGEAVPEDVIDPMRPTAGPPRAAAASTRVGAVPQAPPKPKSSYVELKRTWKTGDTVEVTLPKTLRLEPIPDDPRIAAIMWGPIVLAGDLGPDSAPGGGAAGAAGGAAAGTAPAAAAGITGANAGAGARGGAAAGTAAGAPAAGAAGAAAAAGGAAGAAAAGQGARGRGGRPPQPPVPVLVAAERPVTEWVKPVAGSPGLFRTDGVGRVPGGGASEVNLAPFYRVPRRVYSVYWDLFTPAEWQQKEAQYAAKQERQRRLVAATIAFAQPGEMQPERDFNYQGGQDAATARQNGRAGRRATSWFSFDLPVDPASPNTLVVTYFSDEQRRGAATFEIQVDGQRVAEQSIERSTPARFFDVEYAIPAALVQGKQKVTVRFQAASGSAIATVFGLRMIRANAR